MAMPGAAGNPGEPPSPNVVPSIHISSSHGDQPHTMTLRDSSKNLWHLKVEKLGDSWYFTDGWRKFVKDNKIAGDDVLVYESHCEGLIDFKILGPSGSSEEGIELLEFRGQEADDVKPTINRDEPQKQKKVVADGATAEKRKRNRNSDIYGAEVFKSGEVTQPVNPYFVINASRTRVNELYIPLNVVRCYGLQLPETLVIVDSAGRRFLAKRREWKDGRVLFYGGWKAVCQVNMVEKNGTIICEFVTGEGGDLELHVTFLPKKAK